jgi:Pentapeptide repeats (9 copies)
MMFPMTLPSGQRDHESARPAWRPIPAWQWTAAAAAAVVIVAVVVIIWLLAIASGAKPGTDRANARLDAVRTGLAAGAGAGAAVGLMLAFRRQHHQEIATVLTDLDATERRITELYTKAVEQLGNDKAPVRLGGLYALERLAQDNPAHRQTIVNVICAYLRMPFAAAVPARKSEPEASEDRGERDTGTQATADRLGDTWPQETDAWQQERQVRLTAQRIVAEHLRDDRAEAQRTTDSPSLRFWPEIRLDLAGATLINFNLDNGVIASADFSKAVFSDSASFEGATFGDARFGLATFEDVAWFRTTTFNGNVDFMSTKFEDGVFFDGATFNGRIWFGATCDSFASFKRATFGSAVIFSGAKLPDDETALSFERCSVLSTRPRGIWPTGWCLGPDGSGGYTVVRVKDGGGS